ncbi:MAG: MucB/RseB C-terminal domain-containing protein [Pseudomonadota bacterium]|nr:MucB/RseB C-terminal domain-containing protein [Pseudomonadota bacterium]
MSPALVYLPGVLRARPWAGLALVGLLWAGVPSWAQSPAGVTGADPQAAQVRGWLLRIHEAASHRNFQGTFVVSGGGTVSSARIAHYCEGPNQYERSEALDGPARHVYRRNDVVATLWPATRTATVEQRDSVTQFPGLLQAGDDRITEFYDVRLQGADRVAGRTADVLVVKPRDGWRYGYRLWSDQASGLLLRADVLGERHEVLESSAFSDVAVDVRPQPESVLAPMRRLDDYRVLRPVLVPTGLESEGWTLRAPVPGFRQVSCVKRPMDGAADDAPAGHRALQTIYSDGLTYVSVFIEPYDPARHPHAMQASVGPTQTLMQQQGDWWVTVVGDVPPATLRLFAKSLVRSKP